jgi:hypothetical protein
MNYRNTLIAAAAAAMVAPLAGTAVAADHDKMGKSGASFDALDTNRDGRISRAEASADSKIVFARADTNGDGYIDNMEFSKSQKMDQGNSSSDDTTSPQSPSPQSQSPYPNDASGQPDSATPPDSSPPDSSTPPTDTETPRQ